MGLVRSCDTAIIGGGASGSAALLALAQSRGVLHGTILFDASRRPGPGTAYRNEQSGSLLMNGPVRAMSIVPGDDEHLLRWLECGSADDLISRRRYGTYLAQTLATTLHEQRNAEHVCTEITDIEPRAGSYVLTDSDGNRYAARNVILALGNFAPSDAFLPDAVRTFAGYHGDPWRLDVNALRADVAIIGSRLTAMDVAAQLSQSGFAGTIHMISRRGIVPAREDTSVRGLDPRSLDLDIRTPLTLLRSMRRAAREHEANGGDWRAVVEAIRAATPEIWQSWTQRDRERFLRHAQSLWTAHRYRVPLATYAAARKLAAEGALRAIAGKVAGARAHDENTLRMTIARAGGSFDIDVRAVVNATGPNHDFATVAHPLVRNAIRRGLIRPDSLRLGLDVTTDLRCISASGIPSQNLFTLGPPARGRFYEATAVPEIRRHASVIAEAIAAQKAFALGAVS